MSAWHKIGAGHRAFEKRFGVKVGHVVLFAPGRWHGFFDGIYVGRARWPDAAIELVEASAKLYADSLVFADARDQMSTRR